MKKIFLGLCAATVLFGIHETVVDVLNNDFTDDSITVIVFLTLVAGLFAFLAWLFDGKSPVDRAMEQTKNVVRQEQEKQEEYTNYSPAIKRRIWKFRIWGLLLVAAALWICVNWHWEDIPVYFATVVLIVGIAVFGMGSPADYNAMTDSGAMIAMDSPRKIEEFYRAFRSIDTPLGSGWLGKFTTSPKESLIFGPNSRGEFLYFFLSGDGLIGYLGNSMLPSTISQRLEDPDYPPKEEANGDLYEHLCYHSDLFLMRDWLQKSLEHFVKTGTPLPFLGLLPSQYLYLQRGLQAHGPALHGRERPGKNRLYRRRHRAIGNPPGPGYAGPRGLHYDKAAGPPSASLQILSGGQPRAPWKSSWTWSGTASPWRQLRAPWNCGNTPAPSAGTSRSP